jgi:undecaprenyl-diphosphatase
MRYARRFPEAGQWERAQVARFNAWLRVGLLRQVMVGATRFGDGYGWGAVGVALLAFGGPRGARHVFFGAIAVAVAQLAYNILKRVLVRNRPCDCFPLPYLPVRMPDAFSFPSGHTTTAFAMAVIIGHFSAILWPGALLLATLVGLSRLALGAHFPSDVFAGMILGCLCASLCLMFY